MKLLFLFLIGLVAANPAYSQDQILQERDLFEKAKTKKFEGGAEEGELQVQAQLFKPQRKISPVIEKTEEEANSDRD